MYIIHLLLTEPFTYCELAIVTIVTLKIKETIIQRKQQSAKITITGSKLSKKMFRIGNRTASFSEAEMKLGIPRGFS